MIDAPSPRGDLGPARWERTRLWGREREIAAVVALLGRPDNRLVTLTGTGGTGKTRLAQAAADEAGGSVFVDLAPLRIRLSSSQPSHAHSGSTRSRRRRSSTPSPRASRSRRRCSCSTTSSTSSRRSSRSAGRWRRPPAWVLATSRVPLHLAGEHEYRVPPLAVPAAEETSPSELAACASVRLYVDRARAAVPSFELNDSNAASVSRICRALDGLPLAIELAAARIRVLGPEGTASRLGERLAS